MEKAFKSDASLSLSFVSKKKDCVIIDLKIDLVFDK